MVGQGLPVILNMQAGSVEEEAAAEQIRQAFQQVGLQARVLAPRSPGQITELARIAAAHGTVVAAGGDGTIGAVASVVVGTETVLGVLPMGTLNHFAKDLGLPIDLEGAAGVIASGKMVRVDAGEVNERIFVNNASLGLYPAIVRRRRRLQRMGRRKWPAFAWAAAAALRKYPFVTARLRLEGLELKRRTPFVFIGNNIYQMEGLGIGSRERLDGGNLSLYMTHGTGRLGLLALSWNAMLGRLRASRSFEAFTAEEVWIETQRRPARVALDGEVVEMEPPLHFRVRKGELRVIVGG
jgi:diacylglycerol kinase family enzyme